MSPQEAISAYTGVLREVGADLSQRQFKVENGRIYVGYVYGPELDDVQWAMRGYTPEEFIKAAEMRRLNHPPVRRVGKRFVEVDRTDL